MHGSATLYYAIAGIWGLLLVASGVVYALRRLRPERDYRELVSRTRSWWIMIALFTGALAAHRTAALWFFGLVSFLALKEFLSMIPTRRADRRVLFWAYLSIPVQYYWVAMEWYGMFVIFIPVYVFLFLPFRMITLQSTEGFLKAIGTLHWGVMTCVFSISHAAYLLVLPQTLRSGAGGPGLLLFLVFLTQFNDVAQYVWGKMFGSRKILPLVSPQKTWEGLIGGVATTVLLSMLIAPHLTPFGVTDALLAGLLIAVSGFVGDVTVSAVKRDIGVKDTGALIPGHGGVMDRIDSLTFAAPLFFHFVYYLHY